MESSYYGMHIQYHLSTSLQLDSQDETLKGHDTEPPFITKLIFSIDGHVTFPKRQFEKPSFSCVCMARTAAAPSRFHKITASLFLSSKFSPLQLSTLFAQACSLSALQSCSLTSGGRVLNRSSSTTKPLLFNSRHSPSSTGRHSRRFPRSSN